MRTIQQVLRELDAKEIEEKYYRKHPILLVEINDYDDMTIGEFKKKISDRFQKYLERLRNLDADLSNEKQSILFVHKGQTDDDFLLGHMVSLIEKDELMATEDVSEIPTYAYELVEQKEALAFGVADNKLTQDNLLEVAVDFLYEMSWFGFEQERLQDTLKEFDEPGEFVYADHEIMF